MSSTSMPLRRHGPDRQQAADAAHAHAHARDRSTRRAPIVVLRPPVETADFVQEDWAGRPAAPIIPSDTVAGRALLAVIAIMSLLAALTLGAAVLVRGAAADWRAAVARELTIQVRPVTGRDLEADVARAVSIARSIVGIASVRPYSKEDSARLLEPWLGAGLVLDELPIPRLIAITVAAQAEPDLALLRSRLVAETPSASLDDHRGFVSRMRTMTQMAALAGMAVLALMIGATILLVAFATRGAMAANRQIVEVLHFVGAKNRYIAAQFQGHFLRLGIKGACLGGGMAVAAFLLARLVGVFAATEGVRPDVETLFGAAMLGLDGYAGMVGVMVLVVAVAAITSRWTVHHTLRSLD